MTALEKALWERLRREQIGFKFRRQYPAGPYPLDFYCAAAKLCVEVDGPQHDEFVDARRDDHLAREGVRTLGFTSQHVYDDSERVVERIRIVCESRVSD